MRELIERLQSSMGPRELKSELRRIRSSMKYDETRALINLAIDSNLRPGELKRLMDSLRHKEGYSKHDAENLVDMVKRVHG